MTFGETLREARRGRGLTLERVARSCSTVRGYLCGIECGKISPPAPVMTRKIARALGLDPEAMVAFGWWEKRPEGVTLEMLKKVALIVLLCHSGLLFW